MMLLKQIKFSRITVQKHNFYVVYNNLFHYFIPQFE